MVEGFQPECWNRWHTCSTLEAVRASCSVVSQREYTGDGYRAPEGRSVTGWRDAMLLEGIFGVGRQWLDFRIPRGVWTHLSDCQAPRSLPLPLSAKPQTFLLLSLGSGQALY